MTIPILRLSVRQNELVELGLRMVVMNHNILQQTGQSPGAYSRLGTWHLAWKSGTYAEDFMQELRAVHSLAFLKRNTGFRLIAGYINTGIMLFAVRLALQRVREKPQTLVAPRFGRTAARFTRNLEASRRQAKRLVISAYGKPELDILSANWKAFLLWLRFHLVVSPRPPRLRNPVYCFRKLLLDRFVESTKAELRNRREAIPSDSVLRKWIRTEQSNIRRDRRPLVFGQLVRDPQLAASTFADYVIQRTAKLRLKENCHVEK